MEHAERFIVYKVGSPGNDNSGFNSTQGQGFDHNFSEISFSFPCYHQCQGKFSYDPLEIRKDCVLFYSYTWD
jgi:hypothetical protein